MRRRVDRSRRPHLLCEITHFSSVVEALARFRNTHKHTRRHECEESFGSTLADLKCPDIIGGSDRSRQPDRLSREGRTGRAAVVSEALAVIFCSQFYTLTVLIKQFSLQTVKFFQHVSSSKELL